MEVNGCGEWYQYVKKGGNDDGSVAPYVGVSNESAQERYHRCDAAPHVDGGCCRRRRLMERPREEGDQVCGHPVVGEPLCDLHPCAVGRSKIRGNRRLGRRMEDPEAENMYLL